MGRAVPVNIGRHDPPQSQPEAAPAPVPTGIDYLSLSRQAGGRSVRRTRRVPALAADGGVEL